jgi:hypothetical protein
MLQDPRIEDLRAAVQDSGGTITHDLPIISAVGARLSREQLDAAKARMPDIARIIDDLAWTPEPEPPVDGECHLAGAIELEWSGARATWVLFNKGNTPLRITELALAADAGAPMLASATLGPFELAERNPGAADRSLIWRSEDGLDIAAQGTVQLLLNFGQAPANPRATQRALTLKASAGSACSTALVPIYDAPEGDSYYPTVTGASLLHSHGVTGAGIGIAVLDSGLWENSDELRADTRGKVRVSARYDAIAGREVEEARDESGHGTHIASVIARSAPVTRGGSAAPSYKGIAPDATLAVVKAFGESGEAGFLDIVRGIQWVVEQRESLGIRVLNLSFAARPRWPYWEDPVNQALMQAWAAGLFIVAAAGNEGPEPMTTGSPGNLPYLLTVGAVTDSWTESNRNDDYIPDFSSRGPTPLGHIKPDLVAPGGHMAGITAPDSTLAREFPEYFLSTGEFVMTGSSQAAAVVSGLAALLLQLEPDLSNDELKCMLTSTAEPAIEPDGRLSYSPFVQGAGLVSAQRALTIGARECEQQLLSLRADLQGDDHYAGPAIFREDAPPSLPDEAMLIAEPQPEEGPSDSRRWGAAAHLERLDAPNPQSPIDWMRVYAEEQARIRDLIQE